MDIRDKRVVGVFVRFRAPLHQILDTHKAQESKSRVSFSGPKSFNASSFWHLKTVQKGVSAFYQLSFDTINIISDKSSFDDVIYWCFHGLKVLNVRPFLKYFFLEIKICKICN
jgi:hypothetical protein